MVLVSTQVDVKVVGSTFVLTDVTVTWFVWVSVFVAVCTEVTDDTIVEVLVSVCVLVCDFL